MIEYLSFVVLVSLFVKFLRTLGEKWGIIEYLQVHAPNEFFHKLFTCEFCQSFWLGMILCIGVVLFGAPIEYLFVPFFSANIR